MSERRLAILSEMGLAPVWRLRRRSETPGTEESDWTRLEREVPACTACALHKSRTQTVLGVGDRSADWLLVGEAPGWRPSTASRSAARCSRPQSC